MDNKDELKTIGGIVKQKSVADILLTLPKPRNQVAMLEKQMIGAINDIKVHEIKLKSDKKYIK